MDTKKLRDTRERFIFQGGSEYAIRLADEIERLTRFEQAYREWSEKSEWVQDEISAGTLPAKYLGYHRADIVHAEITRLRAENEALHKAYWKMRNAAAGYSNYCDDNASVRRCERDYEEAEAMYRALPAPLKP